uniref:Striatin N-terminal domain-containing protein n=1 Tax=Meloidogyne enterolobii TaxID=390850 RepID=A0A6V7WXD1_MELEN|nr:unnamed protein product [Meloidogyne enterolobii]
MEKTGQIGSSLLAISETATNSTANGNTMAPGNDQKDNESKRSQNTSGYSMAGVLHFLQNECSQYELERSQWEIEKAELRARITFLIGERKSQENLKFDLVRRIKMLELALRQERAKHLEIIKKYEQPQQNGEVDQIDGEEQNHLVVNTKSTVPLDIDSILPSKTNDNNQSSNGGILSNKELYRARETLQQYLHEIGYTDKILSLRSFRVNQLLGLLPKMDEEEKTNSDDERRPNAAEWALLRSEHAILEAADAIKQSRQHQEKLQESSNLKKNAENADNSDSSSDDNAEADLDADAVEAFNEFSFLKNEEGGNERVWNPKGNLESMDVSKQRKLDEMKKELKHDQERRRQQSLAKARSVFDDSDQKNKFNNTIQQNQQSQSQSAADIPFEEEKYEGIKTVFDKEEENVQQLHWNVHYTLRSHYDSIRAMQFHPIEPVLITASEDGTAKLWDLNSSSVGSKTGGGGGNYDDGSGKGFPSTGIADIEPLYTFRGHRGAILAMDMSPMGETCYTAGLDGVICCWTIPSTVGLDVYQTFDPNLLQERLNGHTDAIWSLSYHSSSNRLISASADGTIRIWVVGLADGAMPTPLLKTITELDKPRSIDVVSTESQQLLCACVHSQCHIRDFETGQIVLNFQKVEDGDEVNKILSHPTMPVTITAGENRKIRFFDNNTGKIICSTMAHVEGVSTLAIDPNGLYMLSASHDGSVRFWNAEKKICLQEIAAHRKKFGSGVMAVAFHPSRQMIGSAGADGLAKVYGTGQNTNNNNLPSSSFPMPTTTSPTSSSSSGSSAGSSPLQKYQQQQNIASSQL